MLLLYVDNVNSWGRPINRVLTIFLFCFLHVSTVYTKAANRLPFTLCARSQLIISVYVQLLNPKGMVQREGQVKFRCSCVKNYRSICVICPDLFVYFGTMSCLLAFLLVFLLFLVFLISVLFHTLPFRFSLLICFLSLLMYFLRIYPFRFQAGGHKKRSNMTLVFCVRFVYSVFCFGCMFPMFAIWCSFSVLSQEIGLVLVRSLPVLYQVGHKTYNSVNHSVKKLSAEGLCLWQLGPHFWCLCWWELNSCPNWLNCNMSIGFPLM